MWRRRQEWSGAPRPGPPHGGPLLPSGKLLLLLCVTSKVLERIVYNHIIDFVNNSISPYQFCFLRHHSTLQQLFIFLNTINTSLNTNSQTDVAYLDFRKAFDFSMLLSMVQLLVFYQ